MSFREEIHISLTGSLTYTVVALHHCSEESLPVEGVSLRLDIHIRSHRVRNYMNFLKEITF